MASRPNEHFALDWIKSDLIETLNQARVALDDYAEGGADETRLRVCLTNLHQLHGTLLMLELEGVTLLADHLEQLAQALLSGKVAEPAPACQLLMQGILEMPGYLDELQRGADDNVGIFVQFVNELRAQLQQEPLSDVAGASLIVGASDEVIDRFVQLDGQEKVGRMRSAYQSVLLSILKGEERSQAIVTLSKIGAGLERLTEGASVQRQWQAFGEFVTSLGGESGALDSGSVRLLRRVDLELKALMVDGAEALRRPANVELVEELLDAAQAENYTSDAVEGLRAAVNRDSSNNTLAISGRQALATAAVALRDELSVIKDKLDLLSRSEPLDVQALAELNQPLKQMGSTLSLLGFESSREIVADQIENIDRFVAVDDADAASVQGVAAALMQIDENLASVSAERNESEQITGEAHLQLLREARRGLDVVKTSIVDFVTANWDVVHLQQLPEIVREVCGALDMVQLPKITGHLRTLGEYIDDRLLKGHKPDWQELDVFADAVSGADYYLERLTDEHAMGTEDILQLVERSVSHLMNGVAVQSGDTVPVSDSSAATAGELVDHSDEPNLVATDSVEPDQTDVQDVALASTVQRATEEFDLEDLLSDSPVEGVVAAEAAPQEHEEDDSTEEDLAAAGPAEETLLEDASDEANVSEHIATQDVAADATGADPAAAETADTSLEETTAEAMPPAAEPQFAEPQFADGGSTDLGAEDAIPQDLVEEAAAVDDFDLDILDTEPANPAAMVDADDDPGETPDTLALESTEEVEGAAALGDAQANAGAAADTFDLDDFAELDALPDVHVSEDTPAADVNEPQPPAAVVPDIPRPDPEILEIFEEEVGEVLEAIDEHLPQWAATLSLGEPLTELRRAFHTLKGSGRIVSAAEIGELAWGIENMLNRVIDETVSANSDFVQVVSEARQLMEPLCEAFIAAEPGDLAACSAVIERADLLASGSDLPAEVRAEATPPAQEPVADVMGDAASAATEDAAAEIADEAIAATETVDDDDAFSLEDLELLDALGLDDLDEDQASPNAVDKVAEPEPEMADSEHFALEDLDLELQTEPADGAEDGSEADAEPDAEPVLDEDLALFLSEMDDHVGVLVSENAQQPWRMSEGLIRALHTLAGTAATAGVEGVRFVVEPANQVVGAYRGLPETTEQEEFFQAVQQALQAILGYLQKGESWEEPVEIVAAADDLIETALARSNPLQELLQSQATDVAFTAELDLPMILDGKIEAQDVVPALEELSELAARADQSDLNRLAKVLAEKMQLAITQAPVDQVSSELLQNGFATFIAGLNELAVGSSAHVPADIVSGLQDMQMSSAQPTVADDSETDAADAAPADSVAPGDRELSLDSLLDDVVQDIAATGETPDLDAADDLEFASDAAADLEFQSQQTAASDDLAAAVDELSALEGELKEFEPLEDESHHAAAAEENVSEEYVSEEIVAEESAAEEPAQGELVQDESLAPADPPEPGQETESATVAEAQDDEDADRTAQVEDQVEAGAEHVASVDDLTEVDPDLVDVFFDEADEICEELEANILEWSQAWENRIHQENMLRGLHTLKGGARLCGLSRLGDMAHDFESLVIEVQNDERPIDEGLFKNLHENYDGLLTCLAGLRASLYSADEDAEVADSADNADALLTSELADDEATGLISNDDEAGRDLGVPAPASALQAVPGGQVVLSDLKPGTEEPASEATVEAPKVERPQQEMVRVGAALLENLVNLAGENSILRARIEQGMSDFTSALDEMETTIDRLREQLRRLEIETETQVLYRHERVEVPEYENFDPLEMDRYSQMQQLSRSLSESASDMLDLKDTLLFKARESETLLLQQARINTELQEGLMRTRMVPFNRLLPRLRRIVRQISGELNKETEFHVQNAEGELDRNLLERMVPPLEHMLRNAVDHGIEDQDVRRAFGKAPIGRIDLKLSREGGDVVIEISDDGAGIDVEAVRAKAIERGLCSADAILSDEDVMQFVLAPGFSTAKSVTQISGRGVGMDVVHSEVKQLGGSISIASRVGQGTRFLLRVPFTVSVNRALMVSVADDLYAIPLNTIEGIVLLNPRQLEKLRGDDGATFEYAGIPYRLRYMGQYLGRDFHGLNAGQTSIPVVLVRSGDHSVAIHVDAVQGSREIVVKSLGPQFAGVGGISGATILGDGNVVVILDLHALIRAHRHQGGVRERSIANLAGRPRCVLVVDDSVTVRKVTSRLLERQGIDVLVAKDGVEAVAMLQERRPDIMLLDIEMPRMDGFEVARQVRHDDRLSSLPIVMISSRTGDKHKEHADRLGVNKFLGKPFQENELLATIDELVVQP